MAVYGGLCYGKVGLLDNTVAVYGGLCYGKVGLLDITKAVLCPCVIYNFMPSKEKYASEVIFAASSSRIDATASNIIRSTACSFIDASKPLHCT